MLSVRNLAVDVQGSRVLRGVSFDVNERELVCLVGRNGAGKTTTLRTIMGFRKAVSGTIEFGGRDILGLRSYQIAQLGVGFAPEESEVFGELTVAENIAMPTWTCRNPRSAEARIAEAYKVFPGLERYRGRGGHALSGGERKMVSIARALALGPKLLLLDEPTEGLSPQIVSELKQLVQKLRESGLAILLVEQNIEFALEVADTVSVMDKGKIVWHGLPRDLAADEGVQKTYLGL